MSFYFALSNCSAKNNWEKKENKMKNLKIKKASALILAFVMVLSLAFPISTYATTRENDYPLVLVHGFAGFGRDELLGYKYWGGLIDLQEELTKSGYTTYTATVGPFSSNWDRACELYAYIKGGTVDYGKAHSEKHGHARYGRTYPGLYTDWGVLTNDNINKIHLVGHSMGGQTTRTLVQLLAEGSQEEREATPTGLSPLFEGGKSWVHSVTTISAPHDGTTLADQADVIKGLGKDTLSAFAALAGAEDQPLYDFKLDQWGLTREADESYISYYNRVFNSSVWDSSNKDFSTWDLSTDGASELNEWVKAQPDVYYFSWTTKATQETLITKTCYPDPIYMNPFLFGTSAFMCSYTRNESGRPIITNEWFPNDGVVSAISQTGPKLNSTDEIVDYNGNPQIGEWNFMGILEDTDHMDIVGTFGIVTDWYKKLAANAGSLPK